jgi:hypothetical protein
MVLIRLKCTQRGDIERESGSKYPGTNHQVVGSASNSGMTTPVFTLQELQSAVKRYIEEIIMAVQRLNLDEEV